MTWRDLACAVLAAYLIGLAILRAFEAAGAVLTGWLEIACPIRYAAE